MSSNDVVARLAAANPIPTDAPLRLPEPVRVRRRLAIAGALAAAVAVPAVAFAGQLGGLLGISNEGTVVSTGSVLPGEAKLDDAMQELKIGGTMQSLGTLNGVAFYASRNADGDFCIAMVRVDGQFGKGFGCDLNAGGFPSPDRQVLTFPALTRLQGLAADGVATVEALDANGNVLDSTPVENNLFVSTTDFPAGAATAIQSLDASGHVIATQQLATAAQPANKTGGPGQPSNKDGN